MRLDLYLVEQKIALSRTKAKDIILSGKVKVSGKTCLKPAFEIKDEDVSCELSDNYVGRGAKKLKKAIEKFSIDVEGKVCLDVGASTGGFTQYMLSENALRVYAVDIGHGQLADILKEDERVVNLEGTDIRTLSLDEKCDFFAVDVSFVSVTKVLLQIYNLLSESGEGVILIKPQFEAGRENIGKNGIVKDKKVHIKVIENILEFSDKIGLFPRDLTFSPITGGDGNIEYTLYVRKEKMDFLSSAEDVVYDAWRELK